MGISDVVKALTDLPIKSIVNDVSDICKFCVKVIQLYGKILDIGVPKDMGMQVLVVCIYDNYIYKKVSYSSSIIHIDTCDLAKKHGLRYAVVAEKAKVVIGKYVDDGYWHIGLF